MFSIMTNEDIEVSAGTYMLNDVEDNEPRVMVRLFALDTQEWVNAYLTPDQAEALGAKLFRSAAVSRWTAKTNGNPKFVDAWKPSHGKKGIEKYAERFKQVMRRMPV